MGSQDKLISVIVPVYNTAKYLRRCVDSILDQTYRNLEVILVDDGSTDGESGKICDEYAVKDNRVRVIHQENGGPSKARNIGIESSKGDYLVFIDSDDYIMPDMISFLLYLIEKNEADIAVCGYYWIKENDIKNISESDFEAVSEIVMKDDCHKFLFERPDLAVISCNKLYKKEIFKLLRFPEGRCHEDEFIIHHVLDNCSTLVYSDRKLYCYIKREGSRALDVSPKWVFDRLEALDDREKLYQSKRLDDYYGYVARNRIGAIVQFYDIVKGQKGEEYKSLQTKLRKDMVMRSAKYEREGIIKSRYCKICRFWSKHPIAGSLLFKIYDQAHRLKGISLPKRI